MNALMLKQTLRKFIKTMNNYKIFYLAILSILSGFLIYNYEKFVYLHASNINFLDTYIFIIIGVISIAFYKIFFSTHPIIIIDNASFIFLFNTEEFNKKITQQKIIILLKQMIIFSLITYIICGLKILPISLFMIIELTSYMFLTSMLSWIKYNSKNIFKGKFIIFMIWFFSSSIFITRSLSIINITIAILICVIVFIYSQKFLILDLYKFKTYIEYATRTINASYQKDYAAMTQIMEDKNIKVNGKKLYDYKITKKNILGYKCFVKLYRTHLKGIINLFFLPLLIFLLTNIIKVFLRNMNISANLFEILLQVRVIILTSALIILVNFFTESIEQVIIKDKNGFFIPYSKTQLFLSTIKVPGGIGVIVYSLILSLVITTNLFYSFAFILISVIYYILVIVNLIFLKKIDIINLIFNLFYIGLIFFIS